MAKKARSSNDQDKDVERDNYALPMGQVVPPVPPSLYSTDTRSPHESSRMFSNLMRGSTGSPMFIQPSPSSSGVSSFATDYSVNANVESSIPPAQFPGSNPTAPQPTTDPAADDDEPKGTEAIKLILYHLDNYKRNNQYCLPASLRPTPTQRSISHEIIIDGILHPDLRDRMILLRGRFDLADCLFEYRSAVTIHGDDVLSHSNWEISESWLRKYALLVDQNTLNVTNRWRRERGETELRLSDLGADHTTST